ncbi:MAG TPA: type II methionyl aminopeptidase [Thermoplasmata archaeon]|nr:type II methionyl aminopeptidase [Thermoplasmata archaeon]
MARYPERLDDWRRAARIAGEARELGAGLCVPGARRRDVADAIEGFIRDQGAQPSFPANLSRNVEAAHFTPGPDDEETLLEGDLVKVDVGAHIDGAIADTATTVEVGGGRRHENLRLAAREALEAGIAVARAGISVNEIARAIESAIHARGLKPIHDLTGHTIEPYLLHAGKSIPNTTGLSHARLEEGEVIAIEPFATNGAGSIENGAFGNIVRFRSDPGGDDPALAGAFRRFRTLPFALRWLTPAESVALGRGRRFLQRYPVFVERGGGLVAQAEHTVLLTASGAEVLTRLPSPQHRS